MNGDRAGFWVRAVAAAAALMLTLFLFPVPARADTLLLKDGNQYVGVVVEETAETVKFRTKMHNIETVITVKRRDIDKLEKGELQPGFLENKKANDSGSKPPPGGSAPAPPPPPTDDTPPDAKGGTLYLVIPIKGVIGQEAGADGVKEALSAALNRKIPHIVFEIDTPGGIVGAAQEMVANIKAHRELALKRGVETHIHAYVRRCISAGIWIAFACDDIWFADGSNIGGAVAYRENHTTGSKEVDAKFNSIVASDVATMAEALGHSGAVVKSMILMASALYAWTDKDGETRLGESRPTDPGAKNIRTIDSESTVLTLTADQAAEIGVGRKVAGGPDALGEALDVKGWKSAGNSGVGAMKKDAERLRRAMADQKEAINEIEDMKKEVESMEKVFPSLIARAQAADPNNFKYTYYKDSGALTPDSRAQWLSHTDDALKLWGQVLDGLKRYDKLSKRFKEITGNELVTKAEGRMAVDAVVGVIDRLKRERNKSGI